MQVAKQQLLASQEYLREHLPFYLNSDFSACNAHKLYPWQRELLLCRKLLRMLTAANQVGKSTTLILLCINMATRQDLWPYWFPKRKPRTFMYLLPESKLATVEFEEKWVKLYLSRGEMKDDPRYGWRAQYGDKGQIEALLFNTGVTVLFRTYSQHPKTLQAVTLDKVFLDEEPPEAHYNELMVRTQSAAAQGLGYVTLGFTATLGQEYLYKCMEMQGTAHETFVGAWKKQISAYDCLYYCDGSPSEIWSIPYIEQQKKKYVSQKEIDRRIMGRFVKDTGLIFQEFELQKNTEPHGTIVVDSWRSYIGIDYGSGGEYGHSSSIVHLKVDPTYSKARVVAVWSSKKKRMTQSDLLLKYKELAAGMGPHLAFADWGAVDLFTLAAREGVRLEKAEKSHEIGINLLNTLFQQEQLKIWTGGVGDAAFLIQELQTVSEDKPKRKRVDDCSDALRYAISLCPMRLTALKLAEKKEAEDLSKLHPRMLFHRGLLHKDDPMRDNDDDLGDDLREAIDDFEELI